MVAVLHHLLGGLGHAVVAQVVEAELAVGAVGDVAEVLLAALGGVHGVLDAAHGEAEVLVEVAHPGRVAAGEVVVHRDELHVLPGESVEVEREGGDERLALAGLHLRDLALMEDNAADELAVERHHVPCERVPAHLGGGAKEMSACVLHEREGLGEDVVERFAAGHARLELGRQTGEVLVCEVPGLVFGLYAVYLLHDGAEAFQVAGILGAQNHL